MKPIAQHYFTAVQGLNTHYITMGDGDQPVIFLHGWGGSTDSFFKLGLKLLQARPDFKLILLDYPGFGLTSDPLEAWDTYRYANWVREFCKTLHIEHAHFYVHSFGGRILCRLMNQDPSLGNKLIFTGAAGIKWPLSWRQKLSVKLSKIIPRAKGTRGQRIQKFITTKVFGARDWGNVKPSLKETLKTVLEEADLRDDLRNIHQPSLIIWGEKDNITPLKSGRVYAENIPQNQFITIPDGRHGIHHTHTDLMVEKIAAFL